MTHPLDAREEGQAAMSEDLTAKLEAKAEDWLHDMECDSAPDGRVIDADGFDCTPVRALITHLKAQLAKAVLDKQTFKDQLQGSLRVCAQAFADKEAAERRGFEAGFRAGCDLYVDAASLDEVLQMYLESAITEWKQSQKQEQEK